jgi:hypothetical protein
MIVDEDSKNIEFFAPDRDYEDLDQAIKIISDKLS